MHVIMLREMSGIPPMNIFFSSFFNAAMRSAGGIRSAHFLLSLRLFSSLLFSSLLFPLQQAVQFSLSYLSLVIILSPASWSLTIPVRVRKIETNRELCSFYLLLTLSQ